MNITKVAVLDRHRTDLGDLSDLKASISVHGLLQPIVVTTEGRLIAGERRLTVCKSLGWTDIPVTFITAIEGARVMVLIFSSSANESRQVRREIELAVSRGLTIMPLRLEQIEPTRSMAYYMAGVHWIEALTPPLDTHFKKVVCL